MFTEGFYFYQFSYAESAEQVDRVGCFMSGKKKDPLLKVCVGIYGETDTLDDPAALETIESICKAAEKFQDFVPILHFTFKNSKDPKRDISLIREKMPFLKYLRLNDLSSDHVEVLKFANQLFLVDIPLSNETEFLIEDSEFVTEVNNHKVFVLIDNSHGTGKSDTAANIRNKIDRLIHVGIADIGICGGYGPGTLDTYFDACRFYQKNFSIDAESRLKTDGMIDMKKVEDYLSELMNHKV